MSHSFNATKGTIFHYNSDFSGKIHVITSRVPKLPSDSLSTDDKTIGEIEIPGDDILEFVAYCYVQGRKISKLEDLDVEELLTT